MHDGHYVAFMGHGFRPIKSYTGILILIGLWHRRRRIACTPRQGVYWTVIQSPGHSPRKHLPSGWIQLQWWLWQRTNSDHLYMATRGRSNSHNYIDRGAIVSPAATRVPGKGVKWTDWEGNCNIWPNYIIILLFVRVLKYGWTFLLSLPLLCCARWSDTIFVGVANSRCSVFPPLCDMV